GDPSVSPPTAFNPKSKIPNRQSIIENQSRTSPNCGRITRSSTTAPGERPWALNTASAISLARINRSWGSPDAIQLSVHVAPGITDVTRIPKLFSSSRKHRENPNKTNLEMAYDPPLGYAVKLAMEHILKI